MYYNRSEEDDYQLEQYMLENQAKYENQLMYQEVTRNQLKFPGIYKRYIERITGTCCV